MNLDPNDQLILDLIESGMDAHPRSQQKMIGPSQIGNDCDIALTYALAQVREERRKFSGWKPTIGTAVHAWLEQVAEAANAALGYRRWVTEQRVMVGHIGGQEVWGSSDLYDLFTKTVYDWKIVGPAMIKKYKANGPSPQYRIQAHLYGLGFFNQQQAFGKPKEVAIAFLPRDGELTGAYIWREPWDPNVAIAALQRAERLYRRLYDEFGGDAAAAVKGMSECDFPFCPWCGSSGLYSSSAGSMFA